MRIEIITHHACPHCRQYADRARQYVPVTEYDISVSNKVITGVPYSFLYDGGTLIAEWQGATLKPLFKCMEEPAMKIRFIKTCHDRYTYEVYKKGAIRRFPEQRAREFIAAGVAVEVKKHDRDQNK